MNEILNKLSSYNVFNYLLPGTLFVAIAQRISTHTFTSGSIIIDLFGYYFIGLVISRLGSLVIEPIMKKVHFVRFAPYTHFVDASRQDAQLDILSEQNNMFRTLAALFLVAPAFAGIDYLATQLAIPPLIQSLTGSMFLFVLFAFAYRKQTRYIRQRVEAKRS